MADARGDRLSHYLMRFKGKYRLRPLLDQETNDFPRDANGDIDESYDDIFIDCQYGNKIFYYGRGILTAYIPSVQRGRNIKNSMDAESIPYTHYFDGDEEVTFRFKSADIDSLAKLMKAKTLGANISPFSAKNLPKSNVQIPSERIEAYKAIIASIQRSDLLIINRFTNDFLATSLQRSIKKNNKRFDYRTDMRTMKMSRQPKEYIYSKGMFDEYLTYLNRKIKSYYKKKDISQ